MKILKVLPNTVDYIIPGGPLISRFLNEDESGSNPSQMWIASLLKEDLPNGKDGLSRFEENGKIQLLKDVILADPETYLGRAHINKFPDSLGILLKLLNSQDRLLVQAHPDDEQVNKYFGLNEGKTEAWYILDALEDARVYIGFKEHVTREYFKELIDVQDTAKILDCLHSFVLKKDDVIIVPANTVHAMGGGSLVAEVQQPCPITLRAECFRPDGSALPRESMDSGIGIDNMLECFDFTPRNEQETRDTFFVTPKAITNEEYALMPSEMSNFFGMNKIVCAGSYKKVNTSFVVALVLEGLGSVTCEGETFTLKKGEEIFIPHNVTEYEYTGNLSIVECYPPRP